MTGYGADEVIERMEAALACQSIACREAHKERDAARDAAAALESEIAAVRVLLHRLFHPAEFSMEEDDLRQSIYSALGGLQREGSLSDEAFALAQRLGERS